MTDDQFKTNCRIVKMAFPALDKVQIEARARDEQYMEDLTSRVSVFAAASGVTDPDTIMAAGREENGKDA